MSSRAGSKKIGVHTSSDKLAMIRSGKKKKTVTGFKENKNITFSNKEGKFIAVEKEKKFEESGVTKKKGNYIMFESKLGTEKERDMHKIEGARKTGKPGERQEERIYTTKKRKEYLDNYQYHETKEINKGRPDVVIHERLGDIVGGVYEETTVHKVRGGSVDRNRGASASSSVRENRSTSGLRGPSSSSVTATKTKTSVTKVGRRGGAGGAFGTTTTSTSEMSTTRGGGSSSTATRTRSTQQRY